MKIVFAGAEVGSNRVLLESCGVSVVAASWWGYRRRGIPKGGLLLSDRIPEGMQVIIESGALRADDADLSDEDLLTVAADYDDFIAANYERLGAFTEFDSERLGPVFLDRQRKAFLGDPKYWPVWKAKDGFAALSWLAQRFPNVAIPNDSIESSTSLAAQAIQIQRQTGVKFHALGSGKPDNLRQVPFESAITLAWMSPMKRGEIIVWDGNKIARYPKDMRETAIPRFRSTAVKANLDIALYMEGNYNELAKLAVWSFQQLEERMNRGGGNNPYTSDDSDGPLYSGLAELAIPTSTNSDMETRKPPTPRPAGVRAYLPVFGVETQQIVATDETGRDYLTDVPVLTSTPGSLRQCDTCFVAANCPAFTPGSVCAFNLPVEVRTKDQLRSLINAMLEMQGQRIAFARFAEELNGGYPDPNTGLEVDRFFKILKTVKELDDTNETVRLTMERKASGGVMRAIFGDRSATLRDLPNGGMDADETTRIISSTLE